MNLFFFFILAIKLIAVIECIFTLDFLHAGMKQDRVCPYTGIHLWC